MLMVVLQGATWRDAHAQAVSAPPVAPADSSASEVQARIRDGNLPRLRWPEFPHYQEGMQALYQPGGYQPLWVENGKPRRQAAEVIEILGKAGTRGLPVEEFDLAYLRGGWQSLATGARMSARDLGDLDAATSLLLMRYLSDLHGGRMNPGTLSHGLEVPPKAFDLAAALREGLEGDSLARVVEDAEPTLAQYRALKVALARYRALAESTRIGPLPATKTIHPGERYAASGDLERLLRLLGDLGGSDDLLVGVKRFQERHGLTPDGVIGPATWKRLNLPLSRRVRQIELALERVRWLPDLSGTPLVIVNIPAFRLYVLDSPVPGAQPAIRMNVVVGRAGLSGTPVFADRIRYLVFSPYWYPPRSIIKDEIVPGIDGDSRYLAKHDMELVRGTSDESPALEDNAENLKALRTGRAGVRQRPGPRNSLGLVKFVFPNADDIYLHDTPSRSLFARDRRDFSHGCIRVQDARALAAFLLKDQPEWTPEAIDLAMHAGQSRRVNLTSPVPIYILYATVIAGPDGTVYFYDDLYGEDMALDRALMEGEPFGR